MTEPRVGPTRAARMATPVKDKAAETNRQLNLDIALAEKSIEDLRWPF
jgi:hypothetical protein